MAGLNNLLYLSGSGLMAYQSQVNVHSQNISNVNTTGYSRRTLELSATRTIDGLGGGVRTGDVARMYNVLGRNALLQESSVSSYHADLASQLSALEQVMGGGMGGLDNVLQNFQSALQDAVTSPDNLSARVGVLPRASSLAAELNRIDQALADVDSLFGTPSAIVDEINSITTQLQVLNKSITKAELMNRSVPELRDERDQLVRELSQKANITVTMDYRITMGGQELLSANGMARQDLAAGAADTFSVGGVDVTATVTGGELSALMTARQSAAALRAEINGIASTMITEVNAIFNSAYNLQGERPVDLGYTFFTGTSAADMAVDPTLYDPTNPLSARPDLLALAETIVSAGPPPVPNTGDNKAGLALFDMVRGPQAALGGLSFTNAWLQVETMLATAVREEKDLANSSLMVVKMLEGEMLSISGVNLDEELMKMMSSQKAYEASARVMSTANSLLDTLMNLGR